MSAQIQVCLAQRESKILYFYDKNRHQKISKESNKLLKTNEQSEKYANKRMYV